MGQPKRRPAHVERAVRRGDPVVVQFARAGGKATARIQDLKKAVAAAEAERAQERAAAEARFRAESANEHIVPIDPEEPAH